MSKYYYNPDSESRSEAYNECYEEHAVPLLKKLQIAEKKIKELVKRIDKAKKTTGTSTLTWKILNGGLKENED